MAHFTVCIVVKDDHTDINALATKAVALMDKFDSELEMPPYRRYVEGEDLENMKSYYKVDRVEDLVGKAWHGGEPSQLDEKGLYAMSTANPEGHFDYFDLLGRVLPKDFGLAFLGEGEDKLCRAVVTMDGKWLNGPWNFGEPSDPERIRESDEWAEKLRTILEENKHEAIFIADCHS